MPKRKTLEEFIEQAKHVHCNKYDYSKVEYVNNKTKVCIICSEHGEFWQKPNNHLNGHNCPQCYKKKHIKNCRKITNKAFIQKFFQKYGNLYDLSLIDYINSKTKIRVICHEKDSNNNEHGEFWTTPNSLLMGHGCPKCYNQKRNLTRKLTTKKFIEQAKKVHGEIYDYSKVEYVHSHCKVIIVCKKCGREFNQLAYDHLNGKGCKFCKESKLEKSVRLFLKKQNVSFEEQCTFDWLKTKNGTHQYLDFYLPQYNTAIECQGEQHFFPVDFGNHGFDFSLKQFKKTKERDANKQQLCEKHNIKVIYICFNETEEEKNKKLSNILNYFLTSKDNANTN